MAKTDDVAAIREILKVGNVSHKTANSEAIMALFAGVSNFIAKYQTDYVSFFLNGSYSVATGIIGFDGAYTAFFRSEIVGVNIWNAISGVSGETEFDINWLDVNGVDQGSIFSVTPKIDSTSSDATRGFRNLETQTDFSMTGVTIPELSKTIFEEGETLYMVLNNSMVSAKNAALTLNIRPI